jgi:hypothetical protein
MAPVHASAGKMEFNKLLDHRLIGLVSPECRSRAGAENRENIKML